MAIENKQLQIKIKQFYKLLDSVQDIPSSSLDFISFLRGFLRIKSESTLPTIEVMTILKKHKPNIYNTLREKTAYYEMLQFLIELSMDEIEADNNLKAFLK